MSRSVGDRLPQALLEALAAPSAAERAALALTVDEAGRPHPALLTYASARPQGDGALRVEFAAGSVSAANLRANGVLTIAFVDEAMAYYVKCGGATPDNGDGGAAGFVVRVQDVLADAPAEHEVGAFIRTGITFRGGA